MTTVELVPGVWTTAHIIAWLRDLGVTVPLVEGNTRAQDMPDEHAIVTRTAGPGLSLEGAADTPGFQLRWRGRQNVPGSPEDTAVATDRLIRKAGPTWVGGVYVQRVNRSGGGPSPDGPTPDAADRAEWTCTYLTTVMEAP